MIHLGRFSLNLSVFLLLVSLAKMEKGWCVNALLTAAALQTWMNFRLSIVTTANVS